MNDELEQPISDDPQLCIKCDVPFVAAEFPFGAPAMCPPCFLAIAYGRLMDWHARRAEANHYILQYVALLQGACFVHPEQPGELTTGPRPPVPSCAHHVAADRCWKCRREGSKQTINDSSDYKEL